MTLTQGVCNVLYVEIMSCFYVQGPYVQSTEYSVQYICMYK